jgi:hypothetical protein
MVIQDFTAYQHALLCKKMQKNPTLGFDTSRKDLYWYDNHLMRFKITAEKGKRI